MDVPNTSIKCNDILTFMYYSLWSFFYNARNVQHLGLICLKTLMIGCGAVWRFDTPTLNARSFHTVPFQELQQNSNAMDALITCRNIFKQLFQLILTFFCFGKHSLVFRTFPEYLEKIYEKIHHIITTYVFGNDVRK